MPITPNLNIKIEKGPMDPEELRRKYPWSVRAYTKEEVERDMRIAMKSMGMQESELPMLLRKWEETYGFKEEAENEFGEVSP